MEVSELVLSRNLTDRLLGLDKIKKDIDTINVFVESEAHTKQLHNFLNNSS